VPAEQEVVVVGGGHNGLVAACYLARAGKSVTVLERSDVAGGGSRTEETIPGFRFDTHSAAHNIINMTSIPDELDLTGAGLRYVEMDPFAIGVAPGEAPLRFFRSIDATLATLAADDPAEAGRYGAWMKWAVPMVDAAVGFLEAGGPRTALPAAIAGLRALRRVGGPAALLATMTGPYGSLLSRLFETERVRSPVAAFAAHASVGPGAAGGAYFAIWQAAYHRFGQWHALGGSQALADALALRLASFGGRLLTGHPVVAIETRAGAVTGVRSADGERYRADAVLAAIHPRVALDLVEPALSGTVVEGLRAAHAGNAVQLVVHVATGALPAYPGAVPGDWNGLQSHVDSIRDLAQGFAEAQARLLPRRPPTYAFTPSAIDPGLAPRAATPCYSPP
jgi:phytoene dehydrogenase-like protein